jgi:hypothetical protein
VAAWLPTKLLTAPAALITGGSADGYPKTVAVAALSTVALLGLAAFRSRRREL